MKYGLAVDVIDKILDIFKKYPQVEKAVLYGSRAKGNFRNGSDIDLTLYGDGLDLNLVNKISTELDDLLLPYTIDLSINADIANADLIDHINRVGVAFYEKQPVRSNI